MRQLILSVGLTVLTGTLLFVYFRNKFNTVNRKLNLVFETIQNHNQKMEQDMVPGMVPGMSPEDIERLDNQYQKMMNQGMENPMDFSNKNENGLIDVSDSEMKLGKFDSSDSEDSSSDSDSDSDSDDEDNQENNKNDLEKIKSNLEINAKNDPENDPENNPENDHDNNVVNDVINDVVNDVVNEVDYSKCTKNELKKICEEKELSGYKSLNKTKLIDLLSSN